MAQGADARPTQTARRHDPGTRLRGRALSSDRTMEAGDRLSQEPERHHPGASLSDVERREDLNELTLCRKAWRASDQVRRRRDTIRRRARYWPPPATAARSARDPTSGG